MTDDERFAYIRDLEAAIIPNIHHLGVFYLGDVLAIIQDLDKIQDTPGLDANPGALGYRRALTDVTKYINELCHSLIKE